MTGEWTEGLEATPEAPSESGRSRRRKRYLIGALGLVVIFGGAGYGIAAAVSSSGTPNAGVLPGTVSRPPGSAVGVVKSVASDHQSFVLTEVSGTTETIVVSSSTTYTNNGSASSFSAVVVGARVAVVGRPDGTDTLAASRVVIGRPNIAGPSGASGSFGRGFGGRGAFGFGGATPAASGTVASVNASSDEFVVSTRAGTKVTVDVSSSTTYTDFAQASASLSSVTVGSRVIVTGSTTNGTVHATRVLVLPARGSGGGFGGPGSNAALG